MAIVRNTIKFSSGGGSDIIVVANYSALPDPTTVSGQFYWCSASQGTSWLPGSLGGTYYNSGMYYSNGTTWEFINVPFQATQAEVNTGTNTDKFVTPETLKNQNYLATIAYADAKVEDAIVDGVTTKAPSQDAVFDALAFKVGQAVRTDISLTSTIVGWSSFTNRLIFEYDFGNGFVLVEYFLNGTSNSSNASFTLTNNQTSFQRKETNVTYVNNGTFSNTNGMYRINQDSNVVSFFQTQLEGTFTASGNKSVRGVFIYYKG